jgi:hypothetical protein
MLEKSPWVLFRGFLTRDEVALIMPDVMPGVAVALEQSPPGRARDGYEWCRLHDGVLHVSSEGVPVSYLVETLASWLKAPGKRFEHRLMTMKIDIAGRLGSAVSRHGLFRRPGVRIWDGGGRVRA